MGVVNHPIHQEHLRSPAACQDLPWRRPSRMSLWPQAHTEASKQPLEAYERFAEARMEEVWVIKPNRQAIGKTFKREGKPLQEAIEALTQEDAACLQARWGWAWDTPVALE